MAKRQTRRTVSLGRQHYERLTEYASAHGVPTSKFTEFALDVQMATALDVEAFRVWCGLRAVHDGSTTPAAPRTPDSERGRSMKLAKVALAELAEQRRAVRREKFARGHRRAAIRAERGVRTHLCSFCDSPSHNRARCPDFIGPRQRRSIATSELAAIHRIETGCTLQVAADVFGITRQAVQQACAKLAAVEGSAAP